jgi:hypothetical protein
VRHQGQAGLIEPFLAMNVDPSEGRDPKSLASFLIVMSAYYSQLRPYYHEQVRRWIAGTRRESERARWEAFLPDQPYPG